MPYRFRPHLPLLGKILMMFKSGTAGTRYAYPDCVATDAVIYASFRGHVRGKVRKAPPPANTFIHVFDWSGKLLRVHHLDHSIGGLDLDRANNVLYTVSNYPDSAGPTVRAGSFVVAMRADGRAGDAGAPVGVAAVAGDGELELERARGEGGGVHLWAFRGREVRREVTRSAAESSPVMMSRPAAFAAVTSSAAMVSTRSAAALSPNGRGSMPVRSL